ncbi:MAG: DUF6569 family protein [Gemmataceae bacterium]
MHVRFALLAAAFAAALAVAMPQPPAVSPPADKPPVAPPPPAALKVSGPITHANLTVFILNGPDALPDKPFLTLQEAIEQKKAVVHETSQVNQLAIENISEVEVFVMAGDIVKGGKQDRTFAFDTILPPKSGKVPVSSFCVEAGRWRGRGSEVTAMFSLSDNQVVGNALKLAVNGEQSQGRVWDEVKKAQDNIGRNVGKPVANAASPSSLQLALEDKDLAAKLTAYEKTLADVLKDKPDAIGFAYAVNGKLQSADVYGSGALFRKFWPKLVRSAAADALAQLDAKKVGEPVAVKAVEEFLAEATKTTAKEVDPAAARAVGQGEGRGRAGQVLVNNNVQSGAIPTQIVETNPPAQQPPAPPAPPQAPVQGRGGQPQGRNPDNNATPAQPATPAPPSPVRIVKYESAKYLCVECGLRGANGAPTGPVLHRTYIAK